MPLERACPGLGDPRGLRMRAGGAIRGGSRRGRAGCRGGLVVGEQMVGAGEELAGDRDRGDLLAAPAGDGGVGAGELGGPSGGLGCLVEDPPQVRRALPGDACRTVRSGPRTVGVSPAQLASLRALPKRVMSPISASITSAVNCPMPGSAVSTLTRGSALACARTSPSSRSIVTATASREARLSVMISRDTGGRAGLGQPAAAGPGPVAAGPVVSVIGGHRMDPVLQLGAEPDQADPVPQQRAQLAHLRRGDPRLGQQAGPQQLRQDRSAGPCRSSAWPRRSPCTAAGAPGAGRTRSPPASPSRRQPRTPPACPPAARRSASGSARVHSPRSC
jgi:hypothetical protein